MTTEEKVTLVAGVWESYGLAPALAAVAMAEAYLNDENLVNSLKQKMKEAVKAITDVNPKVVDLIGPDELPRATKGEGKTASARVEDRRKVD